MAYWNVNWSNVTGVYDLVKTTNDVTNEVLISGTILAIFFVMLLTLKRYEFDDALIASSWISSLLSLLATFSGLLSWYWSFVFLSITAVGMALKFIWRRQ
jgi:hypothetical protein